MSTSASAVYSPPVSGGAANIVTEQGSKNPQKAEWERFLKQKKTAFEKSKSRDYFDLSDFNEVQTYYRDFASKYERKVGQPRITRLQSTIDSIQAFADVLSTTTQTNLAATIVWGGLLAMMKCASERRTEGLNVFLDVSDEIGESLAFFEHSQILYGDQPDIHWPLRDMFRDFTDFCITMADYLCRHPLVNTLRLTWGSRPQKTVQELKLSLQKHQKKLEAAVEKAHRTQSAIAANQIASIALNITATKSPASSSASASEMKFPVFDGRPQRIMHFRSRSQDLDEIENALTIPNTIPSVPHSGPACVVVHGMPGIGKTATALQYTYKSESKYNAIFWIRAGSPEEVIASFASITDKLTLRNIYTPPSSWSSQATVSEAMNARAAKNWLEMTDKTWLLVFDNVENMKHIDDYIPYNKFGGGAVLITTQSPLFRPVTDIFTKIQLSSLSEEESSKLLFVYLERQARDEEELDTAREIFKIVGGLPLAIATIGGYIYGGQTSTADFLAQLKNTNKVWQATSEDQLVQGYDKTLGTVFDIALSSLKPNSRALLNILAYLNPDRVPEEMLLERHKDPQLEFLSDKNDFGDLILDLSKRQLVRREHANSNSPTLSLHRSLQLSILHHMTIDKDENLRAKVFEQTLGIIKQQLPEASPNQGFVAGLFDRYKIYVPQLASLRFRSLWPEPRLKLTLDFAKVLIDIGTYMWRNGLYKDCDECMRTAEGILDDSGLDPSDVLYSDIDDIVGVICDRGGCSLREEGFRRRFRAVKIREAFFATIPPEKVTLIDKIRLYNPHANLACTYLQDENFEEAEKLMELCYTNYKSWATEDERPEQYAKYYHHTSFGLLVRGEVEKALRHSRKALEMQIQFHGDPLNSMYIAYKSRTGLILYHAGQIDEALKVLGEVLTAFRQTLGESNPQSLDTQCFMAGILIEQNKLTEAREYLDHCLLPIHRVNWSEVGVAMAQFRLGKVLPILASRLTESDNSDNAKLARDKLLAEGTVHEAAAVAVRERYMRDYPQHFVKTDGSAQEVHDQMISFWHGRMTGAMKRRTN